MLDERHVQLAESFRDVLGTIGVGLVDEIVLRTNRGASQTGSVKRRAGIGIAGDVHLLRAVIEPHRTLHWTGGQ